MGSKHSLLILSALALLASTAHAEDFQRETSPAELAAAFNTASAAKPIEVRSVLLRSFDKIESGCRDVEVSAQKATALMNSNAKKITTLEQVYPKMANAVRGRDTNTFLKHYFAEELSVRTESAIKVLTYVEDDGHMQIMDLLSLMIYRAKEIEKQSEKDSSAGSRNALEKIIANHCDVDGMLDSIQIDGTRRKNRTELQNDSRKILRLSILPEAPKNSPVFCSERLLQARINFDAMSNEEFIEQGLDVLAKQHAKHVQEVMTNPELIGRIVFDTAKRVDVKQADALHARTYKAHTKTVDRFVAVAVENIETVMEINRLQEQQTNMQGVLNDGESMKTIYGRQFSKLARELNPDREAKPDFKPCAK